MIVKEIDQRFKLLNRETALVAGLLKGGLSDLQNIYKDDSYYYEAFFSLSLGLERLLKLNLCVVHPKKNLKALGHNIIELLKELNIEYPRDSIEEKFVLFLSDFALRDRYSIPDILTNQPQANKLSEPIYKFSATIGELILKKHPFKEKPLPLEVADFITMFHINEDFTVSTNPIDLISIAEKRRHIAKYATMYMGRLIQLPINMLEGYSGTEHSNPYFEEHFLYLRGKDTYFRNRKVFRR